MKFLDSQKKVRTLFYIIIIFFIVTSALMLIDVNLPGSIYTLFEDTDRYVPIRSLVYKNQGMVTFFLLISIILNIRGLKNLCNFDINGIRLLSYVYIFINILLLIGVLFTKQINGAKRWIWGIQPSEFAKISIIFIAILFIWYTDKTRQKVREKNFKVAKDSISKAKLIFLLPGVITFLVLIGKAFTNSMQLIGLFIILIAILGYLTIPYFLIYFIPGILVISAYLVVKGGYILQGRLGDTSNLQVEQSLKAYTLGGFLGRGLDKGIMKYFMLPERGTDYILSIMGEEFGFVGIVILSLIFISFILLLLYISKKSNIMSYKVITLGFAIIIANQFVGHLFITSGTISTGVPLPFYSLGGSLSMVLGMLIIMTDQAINNMDLKRE